MILRNSKEYKQAEIELIYAVKGDADNFHSRLFELITKSDRDNQLKLALGFPEFVDIVIRYGNEEGYWEDVQARH